MPAVSGRWDVRHRNLEPEIMDDPDLDQGQHRDALTGLARLNAFSLSARLLWRPIRHWLKSSGRREFRVLDVATGSGDIPLELSRMARKAGYDVQATGIDISSTAVDHARRRAANRGIAAEFEQRDVFAEPLPVGFDVVVCSLFLHHLTEEEASRLLGEINVAANHLAVVSDLRRCTAGLALTEVAVRVLTTSQVVRVDGPRSVRAAFDVSEMEQLARNAGINHARIERRWPFRTVLSWQSENHSKAGSHVPR